MGPFVVLARTMLMAGPHVRPCVCVCVSVRYIFIYFLFFCVCIFSPSGVECFDFICDCSLNFHNAMFCRRFNFTRNLFPSLLRCAPLVLSLALTLVFHLYSHSAHVPIVYIRNVDFYCPRFYILFHFTRAFLDVGLFDLRCLYPALKCMRKKKKADGIYCLHRVQYFLYIFFIYNFCFFFYLCFVTQYTYINGSLLLRIIAVVCMYKWVRE